MSDLLNIDSIELTTTERRAPKNGAPSSQDYNDSFREVLVDLAAITDVLNGTVLPLLSTLPQTEPLVLDGEGILASHEPDDLFYDSTPARQQLTVAAVMKSLNDRIGSLNAKVADLSARVLSLQTRLATTNQNDVAKAIQGFADTLRGIDQRVATLESKA